MERVNPSSTDFLVLPISGRDLFVVYRFDGVEYKRLFLNYKELISSISSLVGTGSSVTLQVNSVNNVIQNKLDLKNGTNITIVDNGDGSVTINSTGGGGGSGTVTSVTVNASNALSASGNPITTSGTITLGWTGTNLQFVRGDGTLSNILTLLSQFTNDVGFITSAALAPYLTISSAALTYVPLTRNITIQGVTQDLSADRIFSFPSMPFKGGMYIEKIFTNNNQGAIDIAFVPSVNKLYAAFVNQIVVFEPQTGVVTNTIALAGIVSMTYLPITNELWCFVAAGTLSRVNITAVLGADAIIGTLGGFGTNAAAIANRAIEISATKVYVCNTAGSSQPINIVNPTTLTVSSIAGVGTLQQNNFAYNNNPSSIQNGKVIVSNTNANCGIGVIDEPTNVYNVANQTFSLTFTQVSDVKYIASQDKYLAVSRINFRLLVLEPLTSTTFTIFKIISGVFITGDVEFDEAAGLIFVAYLQGTQNFLSIGVFDITTYEQIYNLSTNYQTQLNTIPKMILDAASRSIYVSALQPSTQGSGVMRIRY